MDRDTGKTLDLKGGEECGESPSGEIVLQLLRHCAFHFQSAGPLEEDRARSGRGHSPGFGNFGSNAARGLRESKRHLHVSFNFTLDWPSPHLCGAAAAYAFILYYTRVTVVLVSFECA